MKKVNESVLSDFFQKRKKETKKYDYGSVLVIGGSRVYSGSPALVGLAALRGGADIVEIASPGRAADIVAGFGPDLITYPLKGDSLAYDHLSSLLKLTENLKDRSRGNLAVVIGNGAGRKRETKRTIRKYIEKVSVPVVIDADGIYAFENEDELSFENQVVFTPHLHEFFVLTGKKLEGLSVKEKAERVKLSADEMGAIIVLKGATDIISDGKRVFLNEFPVPELAAGGCGDTLAGISAALLARTEYRLKAAAGAAYLNAAAGALAVEEKGVSLIAEDLIEKIPKVLKNSK